MASCRYRLNILFGDNGIPRAQAPRQAATNTTPTNATNKAGVSGVSFLRGSCRRAVARHNNRAKRHCAIAHKAGTASSEMASSNTECPTFRPVAGAQITRTLRGQQHCPSHSGKFRDERRWDPPWPPKVMTRGDSTEWPTQKLRHAFPPRPGP